MNSLKEVFGAIQAVEQEKVAAAQPLARFDEEIIKQAQAYDAIGRNLAHNVFADMVKQALDEAGVDDEEKPDRFAAIMAKARGEKSEDKDDEEDEDKDDEEEDESESDDESEKKAHVARMILDKMASDPNYAQALINKWVG